MSIAQLSKTEIKNLFEPSVKLYEMAQNETQMSCYQKLGDIIGDDDVYVAFKAFKIVYNYMIEHPEIPDNEIKRLIERGHRALNFDGWQLRDGKLNPVLRNDRTKWMLMGVAGF
jgi:hypothetical protein